MTRTIPALAALAALLIGANAPAASLSIITSTPQRAPGQVLTVTIQGAGFDAATSGGDFSVIFDGAALQFVSGTFLAPFDTISIPSTPGASSPIRVDVFRSQSGDVGTGGVLFDVATIDFNVLAGLGAGTTLQLGPDSVFNLGWFDPGVNTQYNVSYGSLGISAVPAPPALWLLGTAVAGLVVRRFR